MVLDADAWAKVRAAYIANTQSVAEICDEFGIRFQELYARRAHEKWPLRSAGKVRRPHQKSTHLSPDAEADVAPLPPTPRAARAVLIMRLYNAIDLKLSQMEQLMKNADLEKQTTSADHERETRALTGLIRNFERVTELNADLCKPTGKSSAKHRGSGVAATDAAAGYSPPVTAAALAADPAGTELLRRDIAERLERLLAKGSPAADAG